MAPLPRVVVRCFFANALWANNAPAAGGSTSDWMRAVHSPRGPWV
jgi:hypothetical protein